MARGEGRGASGAAMEPCGPNMGAAGEARTGATLWNGGGGPCSAGLFPCSSAKTSLFRARELWRRRRPRSHARSAWCPDFARIAALVARQGSVRLDPEVGAPAKLGHRLLGRYRVAGVGDVEQARLAMVDRSQRGVGGRIDMHRRGRRRRVRCAAGAVKPAIAQHQAFAGEAARTCRSSEATPRTLTPCGPSAVTSNGSSSR